MFPTAQTASFNLPRWLWVAALMSLAYRTWVSVALPITGDEALFYWWARFLDYGYYDHPPMVAWAIALMRATVGDATWAIRVPVVLLPLGVGAAIWTAWSPINRERAAWAVLFYWLTPIVWVNALITTDTPLILWAAWSLAALVRAEHAADTGKSPWHWYALSGVFMAAAILSKYFAVLLGLAYIVYFALVGRNHWRGFVLMCLFALPGLLVNLYWNYTHCWTNIMFNLFNRNEGATFSADKPALYVVMMLYLISPSVVWLAVAHRSAWPRVWREQPLVVCAAIIPLLLFGLMSGKKVIGLHWVMAFYPFLFMMLAWGLPAQRLSTAAKGLVWFLAVHLVVIAGLSMTSLHQWSGLKKYPQLVQALRSQEMVRQVQVPGVTLMTSGYTPSSIYGYDIGQHVPVFGMGSFHARQDDLIVDYAAYEGQTIRIIRHDKPALAEYEPFFGRVRLLSYQQDGVPFYAIEGEGFKFAAYRDQVMAEINRRYYRFPTWMPVKACFFCQKFCGQARCTS